MRACVRACVCACVRACVSECVCSPIALHNHVVVVTVLPNLSREGSGLTIKDNLVVRVRVGPQHTCYV